MKENLRLKLLLLIMFVGLNLNAQTWSEIQKVVPSDRSEGDYFGSTNDLSQNYAIIGTYKHSRGLLGMDTLNKAGAAFIYEKDTLGGWNEVQKIVASDRAQDDWFGNSVSISGEYAVVGAPYNDYDVNGINVIASSGSAYIFKRDTSGVWNEVQKITASFRYSYDYFGYNVSISGDRIVVGSYASAQDEQELDSIHDAGAIYVFEKNTSGVWNEVQKLVSSDRGEGDFFGFRVNIFEDYIVAGAIGDAESNILNGNTLNDAGSAYIFERDSLGLWTEVQKIVASDRDSLDAFGASLSIFENTIVVGVFLEDDGVIGSDIMDRSGSAYIFERDSVGSWNEVQKIVASDRDTSDIFGISVDISQDFIVVGSRFDGEDENGVNTKSYAGSAYIFKRDSSGSWYQIQKIVPSDRDSLDLFGGEISISDNEILVGAFLEDDNVLGVDSLYNAGSAYFFKTCFTTTTIHTNACVSYTSPSGNYVWLTSGIYHDTISNSISCDSIITIELTINPIDTNKITKFICLGDSLLLGGVYQNTAGVYYDTLQAITFCDSIIETTLSVSSLFSISPMEDTVACFGDKILITADGLGFGTVTWYSDVLASNLLGIGNSLITSELNFGVNIFYVREEGSSCMSEMDSVSILVTEVKSQFLALPTKGHVPLDVIVTNNSLGAFIYEWDFGNGLFSLDSNSHTTYNEPGEYLIHLIVKDSICSDTSNVVINVLKDFSINIPHGISPNNDGVGDEWIIKNIEKYPENKVTIFNRWGSTVYEKKPYKNTWRGNNNKGKELPVGTYFFVLDLGQGEESFSGYIYINK